MYQKVGKLDSDQGILYVVKGDFVIDRTVTSTQPCFPTGFALVSILLLRCGNEGEIIALLAV
jgi:hypothetical protein